MKENNKKGTYLLMRTNFLIVQISKIIWTKHHKLGNTTHQTFYSKIISESI
jgi:hypothetical protein